MRRALVAVACLAACGRTGLVDVLSGDAGTSPPPPPGCSAKITFAQSNGCLNDGAVEICAKDDPATALQLYSIAHGTWPTNMRGRCAAPFVAYHWPLVPQERFCVDFHGAMTDAAWKTVCELAAQPDVDAVTPFWSE